MPTRSAAPSARTARPLASVASLASVVPATLIALVATLAGCDAAPPAPPGAHAPSGPGPFDAPADGADAPVGPPTTAGRALVPEASADADPLADPEASLHAPSGALPASGPIPAGRTACGPFDATERARALALVNAARATARRCGEEAFAAAPPLAWDARLERAAAVHSTDMATHGFLSHVGSDGATVAGRVTATGLDWVGLGENVASGPPDARAALRFWLGAPGHCRNLMDPDYALLGAACAVVPDTGEGARWTLVLSRALETDPPDALQGVTASGVRVQPDAP